MPNRKSTSDEMGLTGLIDRAMTAFGTMLSRKLRPLRERLDKIEAKLDPTQLDQISTEHLVEQMEKGFEQEEKSGSNQ